MPFPFPLEKYMVKYVHVYSEKVMKAGTVNYRYEGNLCMHRRTISKNILKHGCIGERTHVNCTHSFKLHVSCVVVVFFCNTISSFVTVTATTTVCFLSVTVFAETKLRMLGL